MNLKKFFLKPGECIDAAKIPCEKARNYLEKQGLLCKTNQKTEKKIRKKRDWAKGWFY